jgi:hemerythrin-like domain-containing protein
MIEVPKDEVPMSPTRSRRAALLTLQQEHRAIAAVMHGLLNFAACVRAGHSIPQMETLRAMLYYLDVFPGHFHHPKEDRYLFASIRRRTSEVDQVLDRLEEEHAHDSQQIRELTQASIRLEFGTPAHAATFVSKVEAFAVMQLRHMGLEEDIILPCAQRELTESDWKDLDEAFAGSSDPLLGIEVKKGYDAFYEHLLELLASLRSIAAEAPPPPDEL